MAQKTFSPLSNMEVSAFCSQMAMILRSGIFAMEGISIMLEDAEDPEERALLAQIDETLQETGQLHTALRETSAFPDYLIQMIRIGEETGKLDDVMGALALYYEREASIAQTIRNADYLIVLRDGRVQSAGERDEVLASDPYCREMMENGEEGR